MRNLKKMLSLVMALAMVASFMVVGASAAQFSDSKDIKNTDAVNTLVSLGVIKGRDTGAFDPTGIVTRAEMAKMICVVMNGGKDPSLGAAVTNFKDVPATHWAAGYIAYCVNTGYVAGYEDGTFKPDAVVTGTQAAKMLLTAIGFSAESEGYVGANWAINVDVRANGRGIYDELGTMNPAEGLSRDNAAQMVYNAISAQTVEYNYTPVTQNGQITLKPVLKDITYFVSSTEFPETILHAKFGMNTGYGYMTGYSYDSVKEKYTYTFASAASFGGAIITDGGFASTLKTAVDYTALFGQKVEVMYKNGDTVFGMYAEDSSVLAAGYTGNLPTTIAASDDSVKFDGTTYKLDAAASALPVYNNNTARVGYLSGLSANDAVLYAVRLIDNDGNGKVNAVVTTPMVVAKIGYVGKDSVTLSPVSPLPAGTTLGSKDIEDIDIYEGFAKDNYVLYTKGNYTSTGVETLVKIDVANDTIEGSKATTQFMLDGAWLTNNTATTLNINDSIDYIALGGRMYYAKVTSGATGTGALAMVYDVAINSGLGTASSAVEAKIIFADGIKKTVSVAKINGTDVSAAANVGTATFGGTNVAGETVTAATIQALLVGELVNYKVNNDGDYELKNIANAAVGGFTPTAGAKILGYDGATNAATYVYATNSVDGKELASDAKVFVFVGANQHVAARGNKAFIYSGKELENTGLNYGTATTYSSALYGKTNGFTYAQAVVLNSTAKPNITTGANYGYLVSDAWQTHADAKDYVNFKYWNGSAEVTAKAEGTDLTGFKAGAVITFDTVSEGNIKNVSVPSTTTGQITGWDNVKKISLGSSNRELTDDTVILYVDSNKKIGVASDIGVIIEAADVDGVAGNENNARWILTGASGVALLVYDVNNNMKAAPAVVLGSSATASDITAALSNGSATIGSNLAAAASVAVADKQTLNVTTSQTQVLTVTAAAGATVNVTGTMADTSTITVAPGGKLTVQGVDVVGGTGLTSTGNIVVKALSGGKVEITLTADAVLNGGTLPVSGDTLKGDFAITGTTGAKIVVYSAMAATGEWNYRALTINAGAGVADTLAAAADLPLTANQVYTWTTGDDTVPASGWVVTPRT